MRKRSTLIAAVAAVALSPLVLGNIAAPNRSVASRPLASQGTQTLRSPFYGARPTYSWRSYGRLKRKIQYSSQIGHVVVIIMENRTVDNLFAGYYGLSFPGGGTWDTALNLYNPNNPAQPLTQNSLGAYFDPDHSHESGFTTEFAGNWAGEHFGCPGKPPVCPPGTTAYSYVPTMETSPYAQIVKNWAFANNVLQANEGPSYISHQYAIAGQSGGIAGSLSAPYAEAENPMPAPMGTPGPSNYTEGADTDMLPAVPGKFCNQTSIVTKTLNMKSPYAQNEENNPQVVPCEEYGANQNQTILDEAVGSLGTPDYQDWQYIAHSSATIWAAPMGVGHLYNAYSQSNNKAVQPFAADPDAVNFVAGLSGNGNPQRPFANLTFITPCGRESDHPITNGQTDGPAWLAYVVNAIGESPYWANTTILVTWDDWGGFYDHVGPFHPFPNGYPIRGSSNGNPSDPNEYGFRVPLMVISPYVRNRAYVSTKSRSIDAVLSHIEGVFNLPSLNADDAYNDNLADLFDFSRKPLPYVPISAPAPNLKC